MDSLNCFALLGELHADILEPDGEIEEFLYIAQGRSAGDVNIGARAWATNVTFDSDCLAIPLSNHDLEIVEIIKCLLWKPAQANRNLFRTDADVAELAIQPRFLIVN